MDQDTKKDMPIWSVGGTLKDATLPHNENQMHPPRTTPKTITKDNSQTTY